MKLTLQCLINHNEFTGGGVNYAWEVLVIAGAARSGRRRIDCRHMQTNAVEAEVQRLKEEDEGVNSERDDRLGREWDKTAEQIENQKEIHT